MTKLVFQYFSAPNLIASSYYFTISFSLLNPKFFLHLCLPALGQIQQLRIQASQTTRQFTSQVFPTFVLYSCPQPILETFQSLFLNIFIIPVTTFPSRSTNVCILLGLCSPERRPYSTLNKIGSSPCSFFSFFNPAWHLLHFPKFTFKPPSWRKNCKIDKKLYGTVGYFQKLLPFITFTSAAFEMYIDVPSWYDH